MDQREKNAKRKMSNEIFCQKLFFEEDHMVSSHNITNDHITQNFTKILKIQFDSTGKSAAFVWPHLPKCTLGPN